MASESKIRALILEDDKDLQELICDYFTPRGYEFTVHSDAEAALTDVMGTLATGKDYDLILTDFRLPKMNGIQLIEAIKKIAPATPIILITAHGTVDLAIEAIEKGAFDFVVKPIQFPQLSISMERASRLVRLQKENQTLKTVVSSTFHNGNVLARSRSMKGIVDLANRVAKSNATVLITGESGTGKEVIARYIHRNSSRKDTPFVAINCSAIPENLLESELFGHAKGSFTGAEDKRTGLFEEANGGTLFLDEIGDMSLPLQAKILRVLQERKIKRIGENAYRDIDVRILAATHKDLRKAVADKSFREDLFFRLNVIPIRIPSLRERTEDIMPLAEHFLGLFRSRNSSNVQGFSKPALEHLLSHPWPGNVRELENAIERAVVLCDGPWIGTRHFLIPTEGGEASDQYEAPPADSAETLPESTEGNLVVGEPELVTDSAASAYPSSTDATPKPNEGYRVFADEEMVPLSVVELRYIKHVLDKVKGVKDRAAKILQVDRKTLYRKIEQIQDATPPTQLN